MKRTIVVSTVSGFCGAALLLILLSATGIVGARNAETRSDVVRANAVSAATLMTSTFTYQGVLKKSDGSLVNDPICKIAFTLYDAQAGSGLVAGPITPTVGVTNGLFTIGLNFGNAFNGNERWLSIQANCNSTGFASLPRQQLTAAPYALALPGLYTQLNATSPNIIGGYSGNSISANSVGSVIGGGGNGTGYTNIITGPYAVIGGGEGNSITNGDGAVIGGGIQNHTGSAQAFIGGGSFNNASSQFTTIAGGNYNLAGNSGATVGGGYLNKATGIGSVIGGGGSDGVSYLGNKVGGKASTIGGGVNNVITSTGDYAFIGGGVSNTISIFSSYSTVGGGQQNIASTSYAVIGGGQQNIADGNASAIGGGENNSTIGLNTTIAGGRHNTTGGFPIDFLDFGQTVGGGDYNTANGTEATVAGGRSNYAGGMSSAIGGGEDNTAYGASATVSGGDNNTASGNKATVGGGANNIVTGTYGTVGGGANNVVSGTYGTVGGGWNNIASGYASMIPGGTNNTASMTSTFAAGQHAKATATGAFVWADAYTTADFVGYTANSFNIRASGGIYFGHASASTPSGKFIDTWTGGYLSDGGAWTDGSDRNSKENFVSVNGRDVLAKLMAMPVSIWNYKADDAAIRHIGPMAQDFYATFGVGNDDKHIAALDTNGVALAAIQGLYQQNQDLKAEIDALKTQATPAASFNLFNLLSVVAFGGFVMMWLQQRRSKRGQA